MRFTSKIQLVPALLAWLFICQTGVSFADAPGRLSAPDGSAPKTMLVEQPHQAFRQWYESGMRSMTVIVLSEDLPLFAYDDEYSTNVLGTIAKGGWELQMARDYPTAVFYPINRSSYLYFAGKAGLVSQVYWVPPTALPVGSESLDRLKVYIRSLNASDKDMASLKQEATHVSGTVNGVQVYIARLEDMPPVEGDCVMAVDLTFLSRLYDNEVTQPMLDLYGNFIKILGSMSMHPSEVVISYSSALEKVPLEHRFLAGYIDTYVSTPEKIADGPLHVWELRSGAMYFDTFFQSEDSVKLVEEAVKLAPDDASLRYDLAMQYFSLKDADQMKQELDRAVAKETAYYPAYITYGNYFTGKGIPEAAEDFLNEARKACPEDPRIYQGLHDLYVALSDREAALAAQQSYIGLGFNGPIPLTGLADDLSALGRYGEAVGHYEEALSMLPVMDTENRPKTLLGLATAYDNTGKAGLALDAYDEALRLTSDEHVRASIIKKRDELMEKWGPFLGGRGR